MKIKIKKTKYTEKACCKCVHWFEHYLKAFGQCRRLPPVATDKIQYINTLQYKRITEWPETNPGDWCGEFKHMKGKQ